MDLRSAFTRAIGWRWTPCALPVLGSVAFVVFCIAVVPDDIGPMSGAARSPNERADGKATTEPPPDTSSVEPTPTDPTASPRSGRGAAPRARATSRTSDTIQSFFRKPEAMPVAPVDPDPGEPVAVPPPPPPTATTFTLPESAPAAAPPAAPSPAATPSPAELVAVPSSTEVLAAPNPDTALPR